MEHLNFNHCMTMDGFLGNCSYAQKLKFEGAKMAMMYVCDGGLEGESRMYRIPQLYVTNYLRAF